jgi:hypothetical protein
VDALVPGKAVAFGPVGLSARELLPDGAVLPLAVVRDVQVLDGQVWIDAEKRIAVGAVANAYALQSCFRALKRAARALAVT